MLEIFKDLHGLLAHPAGSLSYLSDWRDGRNVTRHETDLLAKQIQNFRKVEEARERVGLVARELLLHINM